MAENAPTYETVEAAPHAAAHGSDNLLQANKELVVWTWVTFVLLCVVLYKFAWKPILKGLDQREADIRQSLEDAERIREEVARLGATQKEMLAEAETEAKEILLQARQGAAEAARAIEARAREESQILIENATREIRAAQEKAQAILRRESADLAVALAGRILNERLDADADARLVDRLIKEL